MSLFRVNATLLHLRSHPIVSAATKKATLANGHIVEKIEGPTIPPWWFVSTSLNGTQTTGYVHSKFLEPEELFPDLPSVQELVPAHLTTSKTISRLSAHGRAYPLNEKNQPHRTSKTETEKVEDLHKIIKWLDVEHSDRYLPKGGSTYCNIYAHDYCHLSDTYIPRVWWTRQAIASMEAGKSVAAKYDDTVTELNANSLYNWFNEYGGKFGWVRSFDMDEMQSSANKGSVCIISARRKDLNKPGHICAVAPESSKHQAIRKNGKVTTPVQSNAGASNFSYGGKIWWTSDQFSGFSFWIHA